MYIRLLPRRMRRRLLRPRRFLRRRARRRVRGEWGRLVRVRVEGPAGAEVGEQVRGIRGWSGRWSPVVVIMVRDFVGRERRRGAAAHGFDDAAGNAVDSAREGFTVVLPADCEGGFFGPLHLFRWLVVFGGALLLYAGGSRPFGDGGGEAVGEEGRVLVYVGDDGVEEIVGVGERARGGEGLDGGL